MKLPVMPEEELNEAVRLEVERYVPMPLDSLYLDYNVAASTDKEIELATVAIPKKIVDSYMSFLEALGLEPVVLEPTMYALSRLFSTSDAASSVPSILVDFGSVATDLAVIDKTMLVNSNVPTGIDQLVNAIAGRLNLSPEEARAIKNDKGIASPDSEIFDIVKPTLDNLVKEIEKIIRYHNERNAPDHRAISQVLLAGGGSTMPGIAQYLSKALNMPARMMDPWQKMDFGGLKLPPEFDKSLYLTVAGEAILSPEETSA
jgi:type IV pilus assembly protein PilM